MIRSYYIIISIFFSIPLYASELSREEIKFKIAEYLEQNGINSKFSLAKKLKLPECEGDLVLKNKFKSFKTIELSCLGKNKWKYNVRTNIKSVVQKKTYKKHKNKAVKLLKVRNVLKKGHILREEDVFYEKVYLKGSSNTFDDIDSILGKKIKLTLRKDQILRERHIEKNWTIKAGQKVIIENNKNNVQILVDGIAKKSGMKGEYLDVMNKSSGKIIKAWIKNNKIVTVFR